MESRPRLNLAPERRMALTFALSQALDILQKPHQELASWLREEVEKNPLFELHESSSSNEFFELADTPSLYDHLLQQIRDTFLEEEERSIAEAIIGHLDEKGFLSTSTEEISQLCRMPHEKILSILSLIQSFDPPGVGARNLQESLLIQLRLKKKFFAYRLVDKCFDDLLHGRYTQIKKKLDAKPAEITEAIGQLRRLQLRPALGFRESASPTALPDLRVIKIDNQWIIEVAEEEFPHIEIRNDLDELLPKFAKEEKKSIKEWLISAKWLLRSLNRRKNLLHTIATHLIQCQADYLDQKGPLKEVTVKDLAELLAVHESTVHRILSEKLIEGPWGTVTLRSLLSQNALTDHSKQILHKLIEQENKKNPLTDEEIAAALKKKGILLARRTVAKYRKELNLGSAHQRRLFK